MHTQNRNEHGFTLVELLIVVIILAILAAIVVPQFADSANDARQSAFSTDLGNMRAVVELYRQQHGAYPGAVGATAGTCVNGSAVVAAVGAAAFTAQLANYTNAAGQACTGFDAAQFRFGPYLREGIPANPMGTTNAVTVVTAGTLGLTSGASGGWRFDSVTGELIGDQ
jgi:prepilin-type N-terminal cleavage/methylation domain-containing protein